MNVIITQLPDNLDPNNLIEQKMIKLYGSRCPCCGETCSIFDVESKDILHKGIIVGGLSSSWYGKKKQSFFSFLKFWEKDYHWKQIDGHCYSCGCNWDLPPYPTNVVDSKELTKIWKILFNKGEEGLKALEEIGLEINDK